MTSDCFQLGGRIPCVQDSLKRRRMTLRLDSGKWRSIEAVIPSSPGAVSLASFRELSSSDMEKIPLKGAGFSFVLDKMLLFFDSNSARCARKTGLRLLSSPVYMPLSVWHIRGSHQGFSSGVLYGGQFSLL